MIRINDIVHIDEVGSVVVVKVGDKEFLGYVIEKELYERFLITHSIIVLRRFIESGDVLYVDKYETYLIKELKGAFAYITSKGGKLIEIHIEAICKDVVNGRAAIISI